MTAAAAAAAAAVLAKSISSRAFDKDHFAVFELLSRNALKSKITV